MKAYIYLLKDPRNNEIRYVGKSINPKERLITHISSSSYMTSHVANWIKNVVNDGYKPHMEIIEKCHECDWIEREKHWISYYRNSNCNLTNIHEGGGASKPNENTQRGKGKGYHYDKRIKKWLAKASYYDRRIHLGVFETEEDARQAYVSFNENPEETINLVYKKGVKMYKEGQLITSFKTISECARHLKTSGTNISRCCKGKAQTHKGYTFTH